MTGYSHVPFEKKTRRFEVVYIALSSVRAQEFIRELGAGAAEGQKGSENAYLQEVAGIVDAVLAKEVQRRHLSKVGK